MAKGCKKCDPHEICEECPEWIFTLADLIMCMMGLFVILWCLKPGGASQPDQGAQLDPETVKVLAAVREAFGHVPDPASQDPVDVYIIMRKLQNAQMLGPGKGQQGNTNFRPDGAEGTEPQVQSVRPGKQSIVGTRLQFDAGSDVLDPVTRKSLDEIARLIRGHRNVVLVKGHTSLDDLPDSASAEQRMDLSLRRAKASADYLVARGVSPDILRVQGCSTFEPLMLRAYTPESQSLNRRVEVEATATLVEELKDSPKRPGDPTTRPLDAPAR
jgi:outer membrane protein OmpA-like peptidoglycan-associated protein